MLERLRKARSDIRTEQDSAIGALMIQEVLQAKKQIFAEETFAIRIEAAISLKEIQFVSQFPLDPPKEPIDIRLARFAGFEEKGWVVFLVIKQEWLRKAWESGDQTKKERFYEELKRSLQFIDELRKRGDIVLNNNEIQEIRRKL